MQITKNKNKKFVFLMFFQGFKNFFMFYIFKGDIKTRIHDFSK